MLVWEERDEQCMVSTIVDGIDNGAVVRFLCIQGKLFFVSTDRIMNMQHFTSSTQNMIHQDPKTWNINFVISR